MPAKLTAIRDQAVSKIVQIENPLSRVGGAPPSDLIFPGLPNHVFTIEFQDKSYWVQNTGEQTLFLEESVIPCGSQMVWESGEVLQVGKHMTLRLDTDRDPRPAPVGKTFMGLRPTALLTEEQKAERQHQLKLLAMLAVISLGIIFFSSQIILAKPDPDRSTRREFERLLEELERQEINLVARSPNRLAMTKELTDLKNALKRARIADLESNGEASFQHYNAIRDYLRKRYLTDTSKFEPEIFGEIHDYAWNQMDRKPL